MRSKQGVTESARAPEASDFSDELSLGASASSDGESLPEAQPQNTAAAEADFFDAMSSGGVAFDTGLGAASSSSSAGNLPGAFGNGGIKALQQFLQTWAALAPFLPAQPGDSGAMANPAVSRPPVVLADPPGATAHSAPPTPGQQGMEVDAAGGDASVVAPAVPQQTHQE